MHIFLLLMSFCFIFSPFSENDLDYKITTRKVSLNKNDKRILVDKKQCFFYTFSCFKKKEEIKIEFKCINCIDFYQSSYLLISSTHVSLIDFLLPFLEDADKIFLENKYNLQKSSKNNNSHSYDFLLGKEEAILSIDLRYVLNIYSLDILKETKYFVSSETSSSDLEPLKLYLGKLDEYKNLIKKRFYDAVLTNEFYVDLINFYKIILSEIVAFLVFGFISQPPIGCCKNDLLDVLLILNKACPTLLKNVLLNSFERNFIKNEDIKNVKKQRF